MRRCAGGREFRRRQRPSGRLPGALERNGRGGENRPPAAGGGHEMTPYVLAQLKITKGEGYRRYQAKFPAVFAKSGGRVLIADESPALVEGDWDTDKVVLLSFDDEAAARRFLNDPDYLAIIE